jgi:hypothetical protein
MDDLEILAGLLKPKPISTSMLRRSEPPTKLAKMKKYRRTMRLRLPVSAPAELPLPLDILLFCPPPIAHPLPSGPGYPVIRPLGRLP